MKIEIVLLNPHKKITKYANNEKDIHEKVYDMLTSNGIDHERAVDCASWTELATDGETYNEERFDTYVSVE